MSIAIRVSNLNKCYHLYDTPRDRLKQFVIPKLCRAIPALRKFFPTPHSPLPTFYKEFWALKDVSFEVKKGETFGIIGRNGAGKSTLLQILCGTLTPSSGSVEINGRVAALLELGAGFNPEFTGSENVYMNASVLGLSKEEIDTRFDSILAFADIGEFIHQPVKTYSSGMFVRLAFAIAIHVEPSILIIDEALSVGDIAFQNKCILKIRELREQGTTLLFVAHDLSTLQMICDRVAWLQQGAIVTIGDAVQVCQEYYAAATGVPVSAATTLIPQKDTGMAKFVEAEFDSPDYAGPSPVYGVGDMIRFRFAIQAREPLGRAVFAISIFRADGDWSIGQTSLEAGVFWTALGAGGLHRGKLRLEPNCLAPGDYRVALGAYSDDLSVCYALSELNLTFSVRSNFPTWGKFIHPCKWMPVD